MRELWCQQSFEYFKKDVLLALDLTNTRREIIMINHDVDQGVYHVTLGTVGTNKQILDIPLNVYTVEVTTGNNSYCMPVAIREETRIKRSSKLEFVGAWEVGQGFILSKAYNNER